MTRRAEGLEAPRPDDVPKLMLGASLTVAWVAIVDVISAGEFLLTGGSCLSIESLYHFNIAALTIAVWLGSLATIRSVGEMVASFVGDGAVGDSARAPSARARREVSLRMARASMSPWIPVTCQFLLAGWLIYHSGGTMLSPYVPVPVVMMAIGQSVYETPPVRLRGDARLWNVAILVGDVIRHYLYPLCLFALVLVGPIVLEAPVGRYAPKGLTIFTMVLGLVVSMCVVTAARWRDQRRAPRA